MSRDFARGAVAIVALALLTTPASADEIVETAKKASAAKQTLGNKVDAFTSEAAQRKERALEAAEDAKERAKEAADEAKERGKEKVESLQERTEEAIDQAKAAVNDRLAQAKQHTGKLVEDANGVPAKVKLWFKQSAQGVRDALRTSLLGAALALDNQAKDAREGARKAHWEKLKARYSMPDHAPTMEFSEELREHEERMARLHRARELAESVDDQTSVVRSDHLAEREYARHRRRLRLLLEKERRAQALIDGEDLPDEVGE